MTEKECLMQELMAVNFAITDLQLYLNTHPNDYKMISVFNNCVKKYKELVKEYQDKFGPLYVEFYENPSCWKWSESPWPWEKEWMGGNV